jgi:2-isopropylmalate synthase
MRRIEIYDTTLRDGAQTEGISFSVEDKIRISEKLAELGIHYIEGGWPGSNPRDLEYFRKVKKLKLGTSRIVAFGSTHRPKHKVSDDAMFKSLLEADVRLITIFGKSWDFHVREALKISLQENLDIIYNSVAYLKKHVETVFFDAEHFFDGYKDNPKYALKCLMAAQDAGAACIIPCDTNGGSLPGDIQMIFDAICKVIQTPLGIHAHNDSDCAVANSVVAVVHGASQVQGTMNGLGERCGNANICSVIPDLQVKLGMQCIRPEQLKRLRDVARFVNEIANMRHFKRQPFVGDSAFAHKAGIHVSAIRKRPETYEHIRPELVGTSQRVLISDLAGKSNILRKAEEFGIHLDPDSPQIQDIITTLKDLENEGFQFEAAEASFELLMKRPSVCINGSSILSGSGLSSKKGEREKNLPVKLPLWSGSVVVSNTQRQRGKGRLMQLTMPCGKHLINFIRR